MKVKLIVFFVCLTSFKSIAQITGTVTNQSKQPLSNVNIYVEGSYTGTTSNNEGNYELNVNKPGNYTIIFKYLGFKTEKKIINVETFPFELNAILQEEIVSLNEIVIKTDENPANIIIRKAIENREKNLSKYDQYKADFYSRGLIKIKNAPEKILGQEVGDLGGGLDSTRSGIIYLSETISKIQYKRPDKLKETIIASKVSGDDNGFSFNNASDVNFNFYNNTIEIQNQIISPIADYAFNYYQYKLEGDFYDDQNKLINKIKVMPKRKNDRVFSGYVYIVEDDWSFYALDLVVLGKQIQIPAADSIKINQAFSYSKNDNLWALMSQTIGFEYGIFGFEGDGKFTAVYSNYDFNPGLGRSAFSKELLSFSENANKKDSTYWSGIRPVPLTKEEISDYIKKDSIQIVRKSKTYLDSVDKQNNKFKLDNLFTGYTFNNSYKKFSWSIGFPVNTVNFNTVQGFNGDLSFSYRKNIDEYRRYFDVDLSANYGFSDQRVRLSGRVTYKFNNISKPFLILSGGSMVRQFNSNLTTTEFLNGFYSLFNENNFLKLYDRHFVQINFSKELFNGFRLYSDLSYQKRNPLFNTTDQVWFPSGELDYTSNNPLDPQAFGSAPFESHNIFKLNLTGRIRFDQRFFSYPGSKVAIVNESYPTLFLTYNSGFSSSIKNYNFNKLQARLTQRFDVGNKGDFKYNLKGGTFINPNDDMAFMDYHHFNGNQLRVAQGNSMDRFNNLDYYNLSTNDSYAELHVQHNFQGYILNKIPLINKLNFNLILGTHALTTKSHKPYQEFNIGIDNIGWGKFRFLRVDYVRSYQSGFLSDVFVFGLSF